jgi:hypothetical protein
MNFRKAALIPGLLVIFAMLLPVNPVWSGTEGENTAPDWNKVVEPELWGCVVVVCRGADFFGVIRVKRVQNCEVKTQARLQYFANSPCTDVESEFLYNRFPKNAFFDGEPGIPTEDGEWVVTLIKNFEYVQEVVNGTQTTIISYDAQLKFEKF